MLPWCWSKSKLVLFSNVLLHHYIPFAGQPFIQCYLTTVFQYMYPKPTTAWLKKIIIIQVLSKKALLLKKNTKNFMYMLSENNEYLNIYLKKYFFHSTAKSADSSTYIFFNNGTLLAVVGIWYTWATTNNASALIWPIVALVTYSNQGVRAYIGITDHTLSITFFTKPPNSWKCKIDPNINICTCIHDYVGSFNPTI